MKKYLIFIALFVFSGCDSLLYTLYSPLAPNFVEKIEQDKLVSFGAAKDENDYKIVFLGEKYSYVVYDKKLNTKFTSRQISNLYLKDKELNLQNYSKFSSDTYIIPNLIIYDKNGSEEIFENIRVYLYKKYNNQIPQNNIIKENITINIHSLVQDTGIIEDLKELVIILTFPIWIFGLRV